jgi:hypothetical protein
LRPERVTNDPVGSLETSKKGHADKYAFFQFMAEHLIPIVTYSLTELDLGRLEFVARYIL